MYSANLDALIKARLNSDKNSHQPTVSALRGQRVQKLEYTLFPRDSSEIQRDHGRFAIDSPFRSNPLSHRRPVQERRARDSSRQDQMAIGAQLSRSSTK